MRWASRPLAMLPVSFVQKATFAPTRGMLDRALRSLCVRVLSTFLGIVGTEDTALVSGLDPFGDAAGRDYGAPAAFIRDKVGRVRLVAAAVVPASAVQGQTEGALKWDGEGDGTVRE